MMRIEQKGIENLLDHLIDTFFVDGENWRFDQWFGSDMEPTASDICLYFYRQLNNKLQDFDLYLERSEVHFSDNSDFEISDKALKSLAEKFNAKATTLTGKNEMEALFGDFDEGITAKDVAKFFVRHIERIVRYEFEYDNFDR